MAFLDPHSPQPCLPASHYHARRQQLAERIGPGSVAIVRTAPEQSRNRDASFPYRADSYFYYLLGFEEAEATVLIEGGSGKTTLFCLPKDLEREIWDGYRLGPEAAPEALGIAAAYDCARFAEQLPQLLEGHTALYYLFGHAPQLERQLHTALDQLRSRQRSGVQAPSALHDVAALLDDMRLHKSATELTLMRHAGRISAEAHGRAMQRSARMLAAGADLREFHLEAELLHAFRQSGSASPAYTSIVAAGANACVLHYRAGNAPIRDGDLVLIDAGCEWQNYASDITRTFPANGRFLPAQQAAYEVVLAAQEAAIAACQVGTRFDTVHQVALEILVQGLFDLQVLHSNTHGSVADAIADKAYAPYYMHRTSHWLGLDVHDVGSYIEPDGRTPATSRALQSGMVLTIEPGLYFRPSAAVPEALHHIGIRIEDDIAIHPEGPDNLSLGVPTTVADIERLMRT